MPTLFEQLNLSLSNRANIGSTIGGITAPIVGLTSSALLYLALSKQTEANEEQRLKNESDIVFSLINQLDNELNGFYYKYERGLETLKFTGLEGLNEFSRNYRYKDNIDSLKDLTLNFSFKNYYESSQIVLLIDSFNLIEKRISLSNLSKDMKHLFEKKLISYYDCKLKTALTALSEAFDKYEHQKDHYTKKIQTFVSKHQ